MASPPRLTHALLLLLATCALVFSGMSVAQAAWAKPTPTGLKSTAQSPTSLTLSWNAVSGAPKYRVQISKSSSMSSAKYYAFSDSNGTISSLSPKTRYYFRVRVVDANDKEGLSDYTQKTYPSATTKSVPVPTNFRSTGVSPSSVSLAWDPSEGAGQYRIQQSTSSSMSNATYLRNMTNTKTISGLKANTTYYFRIRVLSSTGSNVTDYTTQPIAVKTTAVSSPTTPPPPVPSGSADLEVASYNIVDVSNGASGERKAWRDRRPEIINDIISENVDVVGVQEANQSNVHSDKLVDGPNQFLDLRNGLRTAGKPFEVTSDQYYNCVTHTNSGCNDPDNKNKYQDRGASNGVRILYNTDTVDKVASGSVEYDVQSVGKTERYFVWAEFKQKSTGKNFFFTSTHLDPYSEANRKQQWEQLVALTKEKNTGNRPVLSVGDFNTSKFAANAATMLPAMKTAGVGDILNQEYQKNPPTGIRAAKVTNGWINSFNGFRRDITPYSYSTAKNKVGNSIDYIFASSSIRTIKEWKMVIDYNSSNQVVGTIPSDHNMLRATVVLP